METILWLKDNLILLLLVVFSIGLMILLHELGHFMMGKKVGILIYEFALGFGPKLWKRKVGDTLYNLRLLPLGGFVHLKGLEETVEDETAPDSYTGKTIPQKILVIIGGPLFNYLGALLLFWLVGIFFGIGQFNITGGNQIAATIPAKPAQLAGLQKYDTVIAVNAKPVTNGKEMISAINALPNQELKITVLRGKEARTFQLKSYAAEDGRGLIGIRPALLLNINFTPAPVLQVIKWGFTEIYRLSLAPILIVVSLLKKDISPAMLGEGMMGPVGIGQILFEVSKKGIAPLLLMCAMVSVILGVTNLLPIPALDGMRLCFLYFGALRGREFDLKKEQLIHTVGFYLLMFLLLLLTKQDIERIIRGQLFFK